MYVKYVETGLLLLVVLVYIFLFILAKEITCLLSNESTVIITSIIYAIFIDYFCIYYSYINVHSCVKKILRNFNLEIHVLTHFNLCTELKMYVYDINCLKCV